MLDFETPGPFHPEDKTNHLTQKYNKHKLSSAVVSNFSFWLRAGGSRRGLITLPAVYYVTQMCVCVLHLTDFMMPFVRKCPCRA